MKDNLCNNRYGFMPCGDPCTRPVPAEPEMRITRASVDCVPAPVPQGEPGPRGPRGRTGATGPQGPQGEPGTVLDYADFIAVMPGNNDAPIAPGQDVAFPQDGPSTGDGITRVDDVSFALVPGNYLVQYQVPVSEAAQLVLALDGTELANTVTGKSVAGAQVTGMALVTVTDPGQNLSVRNPAANTDSLTVTPNAGGTAPASAHLVILRLS